MIQFGEKIDNNILSPNFFNPKLTWRAHLLSFTSFKAKIASTEIKLITCQSSPPLGMLLVLSEVTVGSPGWNSGLR